MDAATESQLPPDARRLWLKALSAFEQRNFGYVVQLVRPVLREAPGFLAGRQLLRRAELALVKGPPGRGRFGLPGLGRLSLRRDGLGKRDPRAALEAAEDTLERDPTHQGANLLLRDAALALGLPEVAGFALETLRDAFPENAKVLHELARHYRAVGQPEWAMDVYHRLAGLNPGDLEAVKGGKDAAAAATISRGGWERASQEGGSYRDALRGREEEAAVFPERRAGGDVAGGADAVAARLAELYARYREDPRNLDVVREIASLHEQKEDFATALEWCQYAVRLTDGADPGLVGKVGELTRRNLDFQIKAREDWLEAHRDARGTARAEEVAPETAAAVAQQEAELTEYRRQRAAVRVEEARQQVERNPTDLAFRCELGEQLVRAGNVTAAIPELQRAAASPSLVGVKAMSLLGQCFESKRVVNLAVKQYETARGRLPAMDALKKEVTYRVALVYERAGDRESYLARMTEIYEVDAGYQDVAARVEGAYGSG